MSPKFKGTILYDRAPKSWKTPWTKKTGYIGISDLDAIGASLTRSGRVIKAVEHTIDVGKLHEGEAITGPLMIIEDVLGEAAERKDAIVFTVRN